MKYISISQRCFTNGSHKNLEAIDMNGSDTGIDHGRAPCCVKVLAVLHKDITGFNNTVMYGTCDEKGNKAEVLCADGKKRVLTFAMTHDNYIKDIKVGKIYKQNEVCYQEGTVGQATGNHIHLEIGLGWQTRKYKDANGNWCLKDLICPEKVFWLLKGHNEVCNRGLNGYNFPWTDSGEVVESSSKTILKFKCIRGIPPKGIYPTQKNINGVLNITGLFINKDDVLLVDEMKQNIRHQTMCHICGCIANGKPSDKLNGLWFMYDKTRFQPEDY